MATVGYEFGERVKFPAHINQAIAWKNEGGVAGVKAYARNEKSGEYHRVFEVGVTETVDGEAQAWNSGNFETVETAQIAASKAYRYINTARID